MSSHYWKGYTSFSAALQDVAKTLGGVLYINGGTGVVTAGGIYSVYNPGYSSKYFDDTIGADMKAMAANLNEVEFPCKGFN